MKRKGERTLTIKDGMIELDPGDLDYNKGNHFWIRVRGYKGNPSDAPEQRTQIMIEIYEEKLRVHTWSGYNEDPSTAEIYIRPQYQEVQKTKKEDLPLLAGTITDPDAIELMERRLKE